MWKESTIVRTQEVPNAQHHTFWIRNKKKIIIKRSKKKTNKQNKTKQKNLYSEIWLPTLPLTLN